MEIKDYKNDIYKKIINSDSFDRQKNKFIEELAELIVALNKFMEIYPQFNQSFIEDIYNSFEKTNDDEEFINFLKQNKFGNLIEEIIDVDIMIEQFKYFLNIDLLGDIIKEKKLKRLANNFKLFE